MRLINWDPGDLLIAKAPTTQRGAFCLVNKGSRAVELIPEIVQLEYNWMEEETRVDIEKGECPAWCHSWPCTEQAGADLCPHPHSRLKRHVCVQSPSKGVPHQLWERIPPAVLGLAAPFESLSVLPSLLNVLHQLFASDENKSYLRRKCGFLEVWLSLI